MPTREQIAGVRTDFAKRNYPIVTVDHGCGAHRCFVMPRDRCAELPGFAFQMVADDFKAGGAPLEDLALFGVSEDVPEPMRPFVLRHEMFEYIDGCTCVEASMHELKLVAQSGLTRKVSDYLSRRVDFFTRLKPYVDAFPDHYPEAKRKEFDVSRQFFSTVRHWSSNQ